MKTDVDLQLDVLHELDWEPSVDASQIGVTNTEGIVTLTGHVVTHTEKYTAEKVTKRVHGVRAVANEIEVRPNDSHQRDDEHIAAAAVHALQWDAKSPDDRIQVTVRDGWITLEGTAEHRFQMHAAERAVRHLIGARGVTNSMCLEDSPRQANRPSTDQIKTQIEEAIRRNAMIRSPGISVEVDRHTVVLTGDVHTHAEQEAAERIAWTAHGISQVENCITITPWGQGPMEEWGY
jgi:osmotically-inducible protein OsmY